MAFRPADEPGPNGAAKLAFDMASFLIEDAMIELRGVSDVTTDKEKAEEYSAAAEKLKGTWCRLLKIDVPVK